MRRTRKWIIGAVVAGGGLFMLGVYHLLGAAVDNVLGIGTRADVKRVKSQQVGPANLGDVIGSEAKWTAAHAEELWRTFVECRVVRGGQERTYHWEVTHDHSPREGYARVKGIFITPLTRATASVAPELVPAGIASALPERVGMSAAAIYGSAGIAPPPAQIEWTPVAREVKPPGR